MARSKDVPSDVEMVIATNRKARHMYFIVSTLEAGIVLQGTEVKSAREGRVNLADSHATIKEGEVYLESVHISPYERGTTNFHEPTRTRKLLLHRREIRKLTVKVLERGMSLVPLQVYFRNGKVKVELALVRGKKQFDRRDTITKRDAERDMQRESKMSRREF
jgi:SsrA-binding protein